MQYLREKIAGKLDLSRRPEFITSERYAGSFEADSAALKALFGSLALLDGRMRMLVRRDGSYLAGCSGALGLLEDGACLRRSGGRVEASQPEYNCELREILQFKAPEVRTLALPCRMIDGHLLLRATSVCKDVVCMSLQPATEMVEPELANLKEVFGLTTAEASIVYDLFLGHTPQQISEAHDNSIHTIRAHIRRCYDKLGITCREELWRKLNAYRLS